LQQHAGQVAAVIGAGLQILQRVGGPQQRGDGYGTVSSSLIAVPAQDPLALVWRYAAGPPDVTDYKNYGNLGRRLLADDGPLPSDRAPGS